MFLNLWTLNILLSLMFLAKGQSFITEIRATEVNIAAIIPTAPGEIGINPVSDEIGPASQYAAPIGPDTQLLQPEAGTTKWLAGHTNYLALETITTNVDNVPTTSIASVQISAITATASADGLAPGDVTILLPPALAEKLRVAADAASFACSAAINNRRKRSLADDFMGCVIDAARRASEPGGVFDNINPQNLERFVLELTENAGPALANAWQIAKTQADRNKLALFIGFVAINGVTYKLKYPAGRVGPTTTTPPRTSTTSTACNPTATVDENSPGCWEDDCKGDKDKRCTTEQKKGCRCASLGNYIPGNHFGMDFYQLQRSILAEALSGPPIQVPPMCGINGNGKNFNGDAKSDPENFCVCNSAGIKGIYPTLTATDSPCAYQSLPEKTIEVTIKPPAHTGPPTYCRVITETFLDVAPTGVFTVCTCNDDQKYPVSTRTDGLAILCPTSVPPHPEPTSPLNAFPINEPQCNVDATVTFARDGDHSVLNAINSFCSRLTSSDKFAGAESYVDPDSQTSDPNSRISLTATGSPGACPKGVDFKVDLKGLGKAKCVANFLRTVDDCGPFSKEDPHNANWKKGGVLYNDCVIWQVGTQSN